jgi:hypothetical protein
VTALQCRDVDFHALWRLFVAVGELAYRAHDGCYHARPLMCNKILIDMSSRRRNF